MIEIMIMFWIFGLIGMALPILLGGTETSLKEKLILILILQAIYTAAEISIILLINT